MWYWHDMSVWGWLMMVGFLVLVILLIAWIIQTTTQRRDESGGNRALRLLDERLALGEIEREEYEERRRLLETPRLGH